MHPPALPLGQPTPVCHYRHGDTLRSRNVSDVVLWGTVDVPAPPAWLTADWQRETSQQLALEPGDVETMSLARTQRRWPDLRQCVQAMRDWAQAQGLQNVLAHSEMALMACRGARYHHDGAQYGGMAFCNVFLSEDKGQDLHFAATGLRIPLRRGTAVVFDTCQPHAVVARNRSGFDTADFSTDADNSQVFLTWELPIEDLCVAQVLRIAFDTDPANALPLQEEQVWANGASATLCPDTGRWR